MWANRGSDSQLAALTRMDETRMQAGFCPLCTPRAAQLGTSPTHTPQNTPGMGIHLQRTLSRRALGGSFFICPRLAANTRPCELRPTDSPAKSRQASRLQPGGKGCWGAPSYSSPTHTALGCSPAREGVTQRTKGLYRSDTKLEQTHNQERFELSEKTKAGIRVTMPLLFLSRPMFWTKAGVAHLRLLR